MANKSDGGETSLRASRGSAGLWGGSGAARSTCTYIYMNTYTHVRAHAVFVGVVHHTHGCCVCGRGLIHRIAAVLMRYFDGPTDNWGEWAVRARCTRYVQLQPGRGPWGCRSRYAQRGPGHRACFYCPRPRPAHAEEMEMRVGALGFIHQSTCPAHAGSTGHSNMLPCALTHDQNLLIHYSR